MDILIKIGMLLISLLVVGAMIALLVAIVRLFMRSGLFRNGATNQDITRNFIRAFFTQDALKSENEISEKTGIWRTALSFIVMLGLILVVCLFIVPQLGINS